MDDLAIGGNKVHTIDVLDITTENSSATIIADLTDFRQVPNDTFDCLLITQVLVLIKNLAKAVINLVRILKPGGVILCTQPSITRISLFPGEGEN
jgi:ubiquinone/menaquinone biosynthesis C-methylase UbiE